MANLPKPTDKSVPSDDIRDHIFAGGKLDEVVTSDNPKYTDRLGREHYTVEGIRQNVVPLSRQYMTLAEAQADIVNIPNGSSTYVRSADGSSLADEYINNNGTLEPTGRKMPSQDGINAVDVARSELIDSITNAPLFLFCDQDGFFIANIAFDSDTKKPAFNLGAVTFSRSDNSIFSVTDEDGFTVSLDSIIKRVRGIEAGNFVYSGRGIQRGGENILEVVDEDGFTFSIDSLVRRIEKLESGSGFNISALSKMESLAQSSRTAVSFPVSAPIACLSKGLNIFIFYGQSLAIGDEAFSIVTREPSKLGNLMLGQAVRGQYYARTNDATFGVIGGENKYYPLEEKRQDGATIVTDPAISTKFGETIASGFMETLKTLHNKSVGMKNDDSVTLACSVTGAIGTGLSTLLKGASTPYYQRLMSCVQGHVEAAATAGYTDIQVAGFIFLQGENDYGTSTTKESYQQMLNKLFNDANSDIKALTGQVADIGCFLYQTSGHYVTNAQGNTLPVGMAQLDITQRLDAFMVAPVFPYPQAASTMTHLAANSYRWWGCAAAHAVHRIFNEENHSPFRMVGAEYDGSEIYVSFMVPCPPISIRPFYQVGNPVTHRDYGFTVIDSTGSLSGTLINVEVVSPCVVKITPSRKLSGDIRINIGDYLHGGGNNIADSSPQQSLFKWKYYGDNNQSTNENIPTLNDKFYPLNNFCITQTIEVSNV